jgi:hypothetical protein
MESFIYDLDSNFPHFKILYFIYDLDSNFQVFVWIQIEYFFINQIWIQKGVLNSNFEVMVWIQVLYLFALQLWIQRVHLNLNSNFYPLKTLSTKRSRRNLSHSCND